MVTAYGRTVLPAISGTGSQTRPTIDAVGISVLPGARSGADTDVTTIPTAGVDGIAYSTHKHRGKLILVSGADVTPMDVISGTYEVNGGLIAQRRLRARLIIQTEEQEQALDLAAGTHVRVKIVSQSADNLTRAVTTLVPLWLQRVTWERSQEGTLVDIDAVDILGRLDDNGLTRPLQPTGTVRDQITQLLNGCGHHQDVTVSLAGVDNQPGPKGATYQDDVIYPVQDLVEQLGGMLISTGLNQVEVRPVPSVGQSVIDLDRSTVVSYRTVLERVPSKVIVQTSSTDGSRDIRGVAGGRGPGRYGTVTKTFTRPSMGQADATRTARGLRKRVYANRRRVEEVTMLPNAAIQFGDTVDVRHGQTPPGVVWSLRIPLEPGPMTLLMRSPEDL